MNLENFLEEFRNQFDETEPQLIQLSTSYKDLDEWSSMMALVVIAFVDETFNISLSGDDFATTKTVEELYKLINSK